MDNDGRISSLPVFTLFLSILLGKQDTLNDMIRETQGG